MRKIKVDQEVLAKTVTYQLLLCVRRMCKYMRKYAKSVIS